MHESCDIQRDFEQWVHNAELEAWRERKYLTRYTFLILHRPFVQMCLLYLNENITRTF
jgi:hypothetical protein